jgi:hypothetical protein
MSQEGHLIRNPEQGIAKIAGSVLFGPGQIADRHEAKCNAARCTDTSGREK